jgi:hypothetical protein
MKKRFASLALALVMAVSGVSSVFADTYENANLNVTVNGETVFFDDVMPTIIDGYTYVPIRSVFEKLGDVSWDEETKAVTLTNGDNKLVIYTVQGEATDGGDIFEMEQKPVISNGRTLLPVREPAEHLGADVQWDTDTRTVSIATPDYIVSTLGSIIKGKPLPEAYYILSNGDFKADINDKVIWNDLFLKYADCEGYDELIEVTNRALEAGDDGLSLNDEDGQMLVGELVSKYFDALNSLEDKSFLKGSYKEIFVNAEKKIIVDENYTPEQTVASLQAYSDDESQTVTTMPEMELAIQIIVGLNDYFNSDESSDAGMSAFSDVIMVSTYLNYESAIKPELYSALTDDFNN